MAARLLILFIALPIVELWLLIKIGAVIGVLATIALVLLTAIVGSQLVRRQGIGVLQRIQSAQARGQAPALPLLDGAALLMAGIMLLTPGFISDAVGFVLLVPGLRERIARRLLSRVTIVAPGAASHYAGRGSAHGGHDPSIIEGDYSHGRPTDTRSDSGERLDHDPDRRG